MTAQQLWWDLNEDAGAGGEHGAAGISNLGAASVLPATGASGVAF
jgi:hypothetical protein